MHSYFFSERFKKEYQKLDPHMRDLVKKKILKIAENPDFGKPLHSPLQNYRSERVEKMRIIYIVESTTIHFAWIDNRDRVYR